MNKLISIDFYSDFGCLKKPDTNDPVYLTFNMLHKPALLGILGAITGLDGFQEVPRAKKKKGNDHLTVEDNQPMVAGYYDALHNLKIGIRPLRHEHGNFSKTILTYNNAVGYANLDGGNLMVTEQLLIAPGYRCFILFEKEDEVQRLLFNNLKNRNAEYLPYLGKNEFSVWWTNWREYRFQEFKPGDETFEIQSIFIKEEPAKEGKARQPYKITEIPKFMYFENLPVSYNVTLMQYNYGAFAYTNCHLKQNYSVENLVRLVETDPNEIIQLF